MLNRISAIVTSAVVLSAGSAFAGGFVAPVVEAPVAAAPVAKQYGTSWAGAYVGGEIGYAFGGKDTVGLHDTETNYFYGNAGKLKVHGANVAIHTGYLWQYQDFYFGPELSYRTGSIKDTQNATLLGVDIQTKSKLKNIVTLTWKTAYQFNEGNTLVFGKAGVSNAKVDYSMNGMSNNYSKTGYVVGLGIEQKIDENWSVVGQYEYHHFGSKKRDFDDVQTTASPSFSNVSVGVNYRF